MKRRQFFRLGQFPPHTFGAIASKGGIFPEGWFASLSMTTLHVARFSLMVVNNLHVVGIPIAPDKADTPLIVDADAVLSFSVALEGLQMIARRRGQVAEFGGNIQLAQLALGHALESSKPFDPLPGMELLRLFGAKGLNLGYNAIR